MREEGGTTALMMVRAQVAVDGGGRIGCWWSDFKFNSALMFWFQIFDRNFKDKFI